SLNDQDGVHLRVAGAFPGDDGAVRVEQPRQLGGLVGHALLLLHRGGAPAQLWSRPWAAQSSSTIALFWFSQVQCLTLGAVCWPLTRAPSTTSLGWIS